MTERVEPEVDSDERTMLVEFLDYYRETLLRKVDGLSDADALRAAAPPSTLNLMGLTRHMADVERWWFRIMLVNDDLAPIFYTEENEELDMLPPSTATLAEAVGALQAEIALADVNIAAAALDQNCARARGNGQTPTLRWLLIHMIEEYARHCGHADLLREAIDGSVGD